MNMSRLFLSLALSSMIASPSLSQGFENGSFENIGSGAGASGTPPPPPPGSTGGFGESSFEPGNGQGVDQTLAPPPPPPPPEGNGASDLTPPPPPPPDNNNQAGGAPPPPPPPENNQAGVAPPPPPPPPEDVPENNTTQNVTPGGYQIDPQITAFETKDFGVPPQNTLRQDQFHGPTPTSIPGAQLVTTQVLFDNLNQGVQIVLIDVLSSDYSLPGAFSAAALASSGSFNDRTQQQANSWLQQITYGQKDIPIVIFCSDPMCWLSYNAVLRTTAAGYTNVYWYRGGLRAWQMAGLQVVPIGF